MWIILIIIAIIVVCGIVSMKRDEQVAQQQHIEQVKHKQNLYEEYKNALQNLNSVLNEGQIIENSPEITCVTMEHQSNVNNPSYYWITSMKHYVWIKDETLYLFPTFSNKIFETSCSNHRSEYGLSSSDFVLKSVHIDKLCFIDKLDLCILQQPVVEENLLSPQSQDFTEKSTP